MSFIVVITLLFLVLNSLDQLKAVCTVVVDVGVGKRGEKHNILINEHSRGENQQGNFCIARHRKF